MNQNHSELLAKARDNINEVRQHPETRETATYWLEKADTLIYLAEQYQLAELDYLDAQADEDQAVSELDCARGRAEVAESVIKKIEESAKETLTVIQR